MMNPKKNFINAVAMDCYILWGGNVPHSRIPELQFNTTIADLKDEILSVVDIEKQHKIGELIDMIWSESEKESFLGGFNYALALFEADEDHTDPEPKTPEVKAPDKEVSEEKAPEDMSEEESSQGTQLVSFYTAEEKAAYMAAFEESPEGQSFINMLEDARDFNIKHNKRDIMMTSQLTYLAIKHQNNLINGSFDISALYYMHGYKHGKKAAKKRLKAMGRKSI